MTMEVAANKAGPKYPGRRWNGDSAEVTPGDADVRVAGKGPDKTEIMLW